jgi:hypothetical protein
MKIRNRLPIKLRSARYRKRRRRRCGPPWEPRPVSILADVDGDEEDKLFVIDDDTDGDMRADEMRLKRAIEE